MNNADISTSPELPAILQSRALKPALIAGLVVYFLYLIVSMAPARYAAWAIHTAAPNVWLTSVRGSLWNGTAGGGQVDIGTTSIALGEVKWSLNPWTLLALKPCVQFETDAGAQMFSGYVCQSLFGSMTIKDVSLDFPVAAFKELIQLDAKGSFSLQVIEAELRGNRVESLDARFSWQNANVHNGETWWFLGSFGGQASANADGGINVHVVDIGGPIGVDLNARFVLGNEIWSAEGTVKPSPEAPEQISMALQAFAEEVEPGTFKVVWPF